VLHGIGIKIKKGLQFVDFGSNQNLVLSSKVLIPTPRKPVTFDMIKRKELRGGGGGGGPQITFGCFLWFKQPEAGKQQYGNTTMVLLLWI
jgi:hypothetical protein